MALRALTISAIAVWAGAASISGAAIAADAPKTGAQPAAAVPKTGAALDSELQRARALRANGNFAEATHVLSQLMLAVPDDPRIVSEYGKALAQQGRSQDAVAFLKRATELQPNDWTAYSALGVAYDQLDDPKDAKTAFERALALKPGDSVVLNNYAVSRMLAGDLTTAEKLLMQAKDAGSGNAKIAANLQLLAQMKAGAGNQSARQAAAPPGSSGPSPAKMPASASRPENVVMQKVPVDPLAGPVAAAKPLHSTSPKKQIAKGGTPKASDIPMLRTADQVE